MYMHPYVLQVIDTIHTSSTVCICVSVTVVAIDEVTSFTDADFQFSDDNQRYIIELFFDFGIKFKFCSLIPLRFLFLRTSP